MECVRISGFHLDAAISMTARVAEHLEGEIRSRRIASDCRPQKASSQAAGIGGRRTVVDAAISQMDADRLMYIRHGPPAFNAMGPNILRANTSAGTIYPEHQIGDSA